MSDSSQSHKEDSSNHSQVTPQVTFSDGEDTERYLVEILDDAVDLTSSSKELATKIKDWPSEYHLSPTRTNLFHPFNLRSINKALEIGSGCGAITRYLAENVQSLVAMEGNPTRAGICKKRVRDLNNVKITTANFYDSDLQNFDLVTLIGVLEYMPLYYSGEDPIFACLKKVYQTLSDKGTLVIAIENKLGLKYLIGAPEDHLNIPGFGVQGLYGKETPVTFGKNEILRELQRAGFDKVDFYYPFPDYKLPTVLISESAFSHNSFRPQDLLSRVKRYSDGARVLYDETLIWNELAENKLISDLANSFLILAHKGEGAITTDENLLAVSYPHYERGPYATTTRFITSGDKINVEKKLLHPLKSISNDPRFRFECKTTSYQEGTLYFDELKKLLNIGGGSVEIAAWAKEWLSFLNTNQSEDHLLPPDFIDAVPHNLIRGNDRNLNYIDREWIATEAIPFNWVFIRGLSYAIEKCSLKSGIIGENYRDLLEKIGNLLDHRLTPLDFMVALQWEGWLVNFIFNQEIEELYLQHLLDSKVCNDPSIIPTGIMSRGSIVGHSQSDQEVLSDILNSKSWKVTAPLRAMGRIFK